MQQETTVGLRIRRHPEHGIVWGERESAIHASKYGKQGLCYGVVGAPQMKCHECELSLTTITVGEYWYAVVDGNFCFCPDCYALVRPVLVERREQQRDGGRKMPRIIATVMREIESHRHFAALPETTRVLYDVALLLRDEPDCVAAETTYIRQLWRHLYHGGPIPWSEFTH